MADLATGLLQRQMETLFDGGAVAGLSDRELLERFIARRDAGAEAAFAALVARHGPAVWDICRHVLRDRQHAEDAFQAVFLILARKASSIRNAELLGTWLYGVTLRVARRARRNRQRQLENESAAGPGARATIMLAESEVPSADAVAIAGENAAILHDEMARLPREFRLPVVLHYFEGLTLDDAARRLDWRPGTLRSRLARAREKLRRRLTRRGVSLSDGDLTALLCFGSISKALPSFLCESTIKVAICLSTGQALEKAASASVATLVEDVIRRMLFQKLRLSLAAIFLLGCTATGLGYLAHAQGPNRAAATPAANGRQPASGVPTVPAPGRMLISGRVLDPQGKPVANATVMAYARPVEQLGRVVGQTHSDGAGSFRLDAPRTSSERHESVGAGALAPGFGAGWIELDPDASQPNGDIVLPPEQVIQGRLFDLQGRPARDVAIYVDGIRRILQPGTTNMRERSEGPVFGWGDVSDLPGWPKPAITDLEGRFAIHGIGRGRTTSLTIRDPRYAQQVIRIETDGTSASKRLTLALQPAQIIAGRVTYADTGKPASHASLITGSDTAGSGRRSGSTGFDADDDGRFRANPPRGDHFGVGAYPPKGQPYLSVFKEFDWPEGAVEHSIDLALPRAMVIRGRVTERNSGKAIGRAKVMFNGHPAPNADAGSFSTQTETADGGSYELTVRPGPGYLAIQVRSKDYLLRTIDEHLLFEGRAGGRRVYFNAFSACVPKPGGVDLQVNVTLQRGVTIRGRVSGPDDQPVQDTWMISRLMLGPLGRSHQRWQGNQHGNARNGQFEIRGLDTEAEVPVYFLEPKRKLGATAYFSGKLASAGPLTIRLEPCVTARARFVDPDGKPVAGFSKPWLISMVVTPGPFNSVKARKEGLLLADEARLPAVDPINYGQNPVSDERGRITFPALIPGASYRIIDRTPFRGPDWAQVRKEFTVKSGVALDLGDILIEKPRA